MGGDLISREAAVKLLTDKADGYYVSMFATSDECHTARIVALEAANEIENLPAVDAAPVVHGRWKYHDPDQHGNRKPYCSNCGEYHLTSWSDYVRCKICPSCGAKMDLEE